MWRMPSPVPDPATPDVETVTSATPNKDKQFSELLHNFTDSLGDDLWQQEEDGTIESAAGRQPSSLGKPYLIPDFVTKAAQSSADNVVKQEVGQQGSAQLILGQGRLKPHSPTQTFLYRTAPTNLCRRCLWGTSLSHTPILSFS